MAATLPAQHSDL